MICHAKASLRAGRPGDVESAFGLLHLMRIGHGTAVPLLTNGACTYHVERFVKNPGFDYHFHLENRYRSSLRETFTEIEIMNAH